MIRKAILSVAVAALLLLSPIVAFQNVPTGDDTSDTPATTMSDATATLRSALREHIAHGHSDGHIHEHDDLAGLCAALGVPCTTEADHGEGGPDGDGDGVPDDIEEIYCGDYEFTGTDLDGSCDDAEHDWTTPWGALPTADGPDEAWTLLQDEIIVAYDMLNQTLEDVATNETLEEVNPTALKVGLRVSRGDADFDEDGAPDHYVLTNNGAPLAYLQSDFFWGPPSEGRGMIVDPQDGRARSATADLETAPDSASVTVWENDEVYLRVVYDLSDPVETLVIEGSGGGQHRPEYETICPVANFCPTGPVFYSAPIDLTYLRLLQPGDLDNDGIPDAIELISGSNPINFKSRPGNLDGDDCTTRDDPDDSDPAQCIGLPYDLLVEVIDQDPADIGVRVWEEMTIVIEATPQAGKDLRPISSYDVWIASGTHGTGVTCESDHDACSDFNEGVLTHLESCSAVGTFNGLDLTCTVDSRDFADGSEHHIVLFACSEGEDCEAKAEAEVDLSDHFAVTPHFAIHNNPVVSVIAAGDLDLVTDSADVDITGEGWFQFTAGHHLPGYVHDSVSVTARTYWVDGPDSGAAPDAKRAITYRFDVAGLVEGQTVPNLDAEGAPLPPDQADANLTLVDATNGEYRVTFDTRDFPDAASSDVLEGARLTAAFSARAPDGRVSGAASATLGSAISHTTFFHNTPPVVGVRSLQTSTASDGTTQIRIPLSVTDHFWTPGVASAIVEITRPNGTLVTTGDCPLTLQPRTVPVEAVEPAQYYYTCDAGTKEYGDFTFNVTVVDADRGDNTSLYSHTGIFEILNTPPRLENDLVLPILVNQSDPGAESGSLHFQVQYRDAEDAASLVEVQLSKVEDDGSLTTMPNVPLEESDTCIAGAPAIPEVETEQVSDRCGQIELPYGTYQVSFSAVEARDLTVETEPVVVELGPDVRVSCVQCGTGDVNEEVRKVMEPAMEALNEALSNVGLPVNPYQEGFCSGGCDPAIDRDGDGFPDQQEVDATSDPDDPWSTPVDHDADLWPSILDNGAVDVDLFVIEDGVVRLKDNPALAVHQSTSPNAPRDQDPVFSFTLDGSEEVFHLTMRIGTVSQQVGGHGSLVYEATETGFIVTVVSHNGTDALRVIFDSTQLGIEDGDLLRIEANVSAPHRVIQVQSNPVRILSDGAPVIDLPAGIEPAEGGGFAPWVDPERGICAQDPPYGHCSDSDGDDINDTYEPPTQQELEKVVGEEVCAAEPPEEPCSDSDGDGTNDTITPPGGDLDDAALDAFCTNVPIGDCDDEEGLTPYSPHLVDSDLDGDKIPDFVEALICGALGGTAPVCEGENVLAPADADGDDVPDDVEPTFCEATIQTVIQLCEDPESNGYTDDDRDHVPDAYEQTVCLVGNPSNPIHNGCNDPSDFTGLQTKEELLRVVDEGV